MLNGSQMELHNSLTTILKQHVKEKFVYVPNPGNAGDSFIAYATYQFFEDLNLQYEIGKPTGLYPNRVVVFGGGGNLVHPYPNAIEFMRNNHRIAKLLILLPHTIASYGEDLRELGPNCHIFCREMPSYGYARRYASNAHVHLSHDMALSTDIEKIYSFEHNLLQLPLRYRSLKSDLKQGLAALRHHAKNGFNRDRLMAFRNDAESTSDTKIDNNFDISDVFCSRDFSPSATMHTTYKLARFLDRYQTIHTNRLHVCILSAILKKKVHFYRNSYFKNRAIFEHSLQNRYPNVQWCE